MTEETPKTDPDQTPPASTTTVIARFRLGDVSATLWLNEHTNGQIMTTIEKHLKPEIKNAFPHLAHTFTATDISAIRKLTKETEDALFQYQSVVAQQIHPHTNQGHVTKEEEA